MVLLASAGNDTTKQTTAHAFKALIDHPDQLAWLRETSTAGSVAPSTSSSAGAPRSCSSPAQPPATPNSPAPRSVRATRSRCSTARAISTPKPSTILGFSTSTGSQPARRFRWRRPHHCLGKQLAVLELKHLFTELVTRIPDVEFVGEVEYTYSDFVHGVKRMTIKR